MYFTTFYIGILLAIKSRGFFALSLYLVNPHQCSIDILGAINVKISTSASYLKENLFLLVLFKVSTNFSFSHLERIEMEDVMSKTSKNMSKKIPKLALYFKY